MTNPAQSPTTTIHEIRPHGPNTRYEIRNTNSYVRKNNLFMQNKAKPRKSQMNVTKAITKDYEKKTLSERGKNKPKTNPKQTQNKAKQTQIKANQTQIKPKTKPIRPGK